LGEAGEAGAGPRVEYGEKGELGEVHECVGLDRLLTIVLPRLSVRMACSSDFRIWIRASVLKSSSRMFAVILAREPPDLGA
jgi:hypothetical protein